MLLFLFFEVLRPFELVSFEAEFTSTLGVGQYCLPETLFLPVVILSLSVEFYTMSVCIF